MPPLNEETVVFLEGRVSCGKVKYKRDVWLMRVWLWF